MKKQCTTLLEIDGNSNLSWMHPYTQNAKRNLYRHTLNMILRGGKGGLGPLRLAAKRTAARLLLHNVSSLVDLLNHYKRTYRAYVN